MKKRSVDATISESPSKLRELFAVYPNIFNLSNKPYQWLCEKDIISPRNITAEKINLIILLRLGEDSREYLSIDTVTSTDTIHYPQEFLNTLSPSGYLPNKLKLKVGAPITLLRNLQPRNICNGTKIQIKCLRNNIVEAVNLIGLAKVEIVFIPRIPMIPTDLPFSFELLLFPVKVTFSVMINITQGQIYLCTLVYIFVQSTSHMESCYTWDFLHVGPQLSNDFNFNRR